MLREGLQQEEGGGTTKDKEKEKGMQDLRVRQRRSWMHEQGERPWRKE